MIVKSTSLLSFASLAYSSLPFPPCHPPSLPRFVFAHNCHESGLISDTEWSIYCDWHSFLLNTLSLQFDGIVYLKTDPKVGRTWRGEEERRGGRVQGGKGKKRNWEKEGSGEEGPDLLQYFPIPSPPPFRCVMRGCRSVVARRRAQ